MIEDESDKHLGERLSTIQMVKRRLFAMRNGVVADSLRRAGCPYRIIFGVNVPQLGEIAAEFGQSVELAESLWADEAMRESFVLATMLYPAYQLTIEHARALADRARWSEDADMLCFKLFKRTAFAPQLAAELTSTADRLHRYTGLRLYFNIVSTHAAEALRAAEAEATRPDALTGLAAMLAEEARFILGEE